MSRLSDDFCVVPNEGLLNAMKRTAECQEHVPEGVWDCIKKGESAGVDEIQWLHRNYKGGGSRLHEMLSDCEINLPEPTEPPRNPALEARIRKLKAEQEEREYRSMTKNVDNLRYKLPEDTISFQLKQINRQLIAVLQFIFSVAAGFAFGFVGIELILGNLDFGFRLLLGVMCALIIALAEIYFLAKKLAEDDEPTLPQPTKLHAD